MGSGLTKKCFPKYTRKNTNYIYGGVPKHGKEDMKYKNTVQSVGCYDYMSVTEQQSESLYGSGYEEYLPIHFTNFKKETRIHENEILVTASESECGFQENEDTEDQVSDDAESSRRRGSRNSQYHDGCLAYPGNNKRTITCQPVMATNIEIEHVSTESSPVSSVSRDDISVNECIVTAGSTGLNFSCTSFTLSGSIPEGAIRHGDTRQLIIKRHERDVYQSTIADAHLVSAVYECLPHAVEFDKEIVLTFPCDKPQASVTAASYQVRRCLIYSDTNTSDPPNWKRITASNHDISVVITAEFVNLFLSSFCLFGLTEYNVPVMYVDMTVFGKFYQRVGICKLTVVMTQQRADISKMIDYCQKTLDYGHFIIRKPLCLIQNVDKLILSLIIDNLDCWECAKPYEEIKAHYLWKQTEWTSTFVIKQKQPCELFQGCLTTKHDDEVVECDILESLHQILPQNHHLPLETELTPPTNDHQAIEHAVHFEEIPSSSDSIIPKVIDNCEPSRKKPNDVGSFNLQSKIPVKMEDIAKIEKTCLGAHCHITEMKLSEDIKRQLAERLDNVNPDGSDWKGLANQLGYGQYCGEFYTGRTRHLLGLWEAREDKTGTVEYLVQALREIKQEQLATIVLNAKIL